MVLVVNDADMAGIMFPPQVFADGHEVGWLSAPTAMVVKPQGEAEFARALHQRQKLFGSRFDPGRLLSLRVQAIGCRRAPQGLPDLRPQVVLFEQAKRLVVCAPKGFQAVTLILQNLFFERGHMLLSPIVRDAAQT